MIVVGLAGLAGLTGCNDVRDFAGSWHGDRVVDWSYAAPGDPDLAILQIDAIDKHGLRGHLEVSSRDTGGPALVDTDFSSLEPAEADVLATTTFAGDPLRVYLAFVPVLRPGAGSALAIISLYDSDRIELRVIKGEPSPLYVIFPLTRS